MIDNYFKKYENIDSKYLEELNRFIEKVNHDFKDLKSLKSYHIDNFIKYDLSCWYERYIRLKRHRYGTTLYKCILKYGKEEGKIRWNSYKEKQGLTNTFEYKKEHFGWTKEQFDNFNKTRACTLENMCRRYGKEEGEKRFNKYVEDQRYKGNKKEYFIEKYGKEEGEKRFIELNKKKTLNIETFIRKYGKEEGEKRFNNYINRHTLYFSKSSQKLFWNLYEHIKDKFNNIYFGELNTEFGKYNSDNKKYYKFDFCIQDIKLIIEYNGDHYHANPSIYKSDDIVTKIKGGPKLAADIWKQDQIKYNFIQKIGYNIITVWESDYLENQIDTVNKLIGEINGTKIDN